MEASVIEHLNIHRQHTILARASAFVVGSAWEMMQGPASVLLSRIGEIAVDEIPADRFSHPSVSSMQKSKTLRILRCMWISWGIRCACLDLGNLGNEHVCPRQRLKICLIRANSLPTPVPCLLQAMSDIGTILF